MRKFLVVGLLGLLLATAGGLGLVGQSVRPTDPTAPTATAVPVRGTDLDAAIESLQAGVRRVPTDYRSWALLGLAYVEQVRLTGDVSRYDLADDAVNRSLALQPRQNFSALAAGAAVDAARHNFTSALGKADQALAINPFDLGALSVRVDALTELGRYPEQLAALRTADRRQPSIAVAARYAYAFELRGDLDRAAQTLRRASVGTSDTERSYLLTLLADVERRRGHLAAASGLIREALHEQPRYIEAIVSRARLAVARGDHPQAVKIWEEVVRRLPDADHRIELGELYIHTGRPLAAQEQFDAVQASLSALKESGVNADHEIAVTDADHGSPRLALAAAQREWQRLKNLHVADALAWALHTTGRSERALTYARAATRLNTAEPLLWIHRGSIEASLGLKDAARRHLQRGLATDPGLNPWQADRALRLLKAMRSTS